MASNIDAAIPPFGSPTTAGVRSNFATAKAEIETIQKQIGFADYNDAATAITPISLSTSTWTRLNNDTLGVNTKIDMLPIGVTSLWNPITNRFNFTQLPVNTMVELRADIQVTTTTANQVVKSRMQMAIGDGALFNISTGDMQYKTAGAHDPIINIAFYIGSEPVRTSPAELQAWSDASATVLVRGWYIRVVKHLG